MTNNLHLFSETFTNGYRGGALFFIDAISIILGISVVISKNPIVSVLFLIGLFLDIACHLLVSGLSFIGLSYLLVYVGAVSILFLFILMLINIRVSELLTDTSNTIPLALIIGIFFIYPVYEVLPSSLSLSGVGLNKEDDTFLVRMINSFFNNTENAQYASSKLWDGNLAESTHISSIGDIMYSSYSIWLILTSLILLLAMVGAIVITIKQPQSYQTHNVNIPRSHIDIKLNVQSSLIPTFSLSSLFFLIYSIAKKFEIFKLITDRLRLLYIYLNIQYPVCIRFFKISLYVLLVLYLCINCFKSVVIFGVSFALFMYCEHSKVFSVKYPFTCKLLKAGSLVMLVCCSLVFADVIVKGLISLWDFINKRGGNGMSNTHKRGSNDRMTGQEENWGDKRRGDNRNPKNPKNPKGPEHPFSGDGSRKKRRQEGDENQYLPPRDENQHWPPQDENQHWPPRDENQYWPPRDENQYWPPRDPNFDQGMWNDSVEQARAEVEAEQWYLGATGPMYKPAPAAEPLYGHTTDTTPITESVSESGPVSSFGRTKPLPEGRPVPRPWPKNMSAPGTENMSESGPVSSFGRTKPLPEGRPEPAPWCPPRAKSPCPPKIVPQPVSSRPYPLSNPDIDVARQHAGVYSIENNT